METLKEIRTKIQKAKKLRIEEIAKEANISVKSIYRVEEEKTFQNSIFIKYLQFLRNNDIDLNTLFKKQN